jgi:hypothetical protein
MAKTVIWMAQQRAAGPLPIGAEPASRPLALRILAAADSARAGRLSCTCASLNRRFASRTPGAGDVLLTPNVNGHAGGGQVRLKSPMVGAPGVIKEEDPRSISDWGPSK